MLVRVEAVKGIGLLHDAKAANLKLESCALIYGGNGRGKSTLASILRSSTTGDPAAIQERVTIDGTNSPEVTLQFDAGHKVTFAQNVWSEARPEIAVYDSSFIESNVHSGTEITAEHRKNLLDFALGDSAVKARAAEEEASKQQQQATESIRRLTSQIEAHSGYMTLAVFRALSPIEDGNQKRQTVTQRLDTAKRASSILLQPLPESMTVPTADIDGVFEILGRTLTDVHADAEAAVKSHLATMNDTEADPVSRTGGWLVRLPV
ncbi:AAA family ATPase [Subtercola boreus]|uniref:AAA family ATPase n=1 Tax=Subtercola boreus TaxID=120213 RepID=UPI000E2A1261|nr:AAA family ATPase [Subtercola boreus]